MENVAGILKTSTILISAENAVSVYHSMEEVPERLRASLLQSTSGVDAGTILIADHKGKDRIATAIRKLPVSVRQRYLASVARNRLERLVARRILGWPLRNWFGIASVFLAGGLAWLVSAHPW